MGINPKTVAKWRKRATVEDMKTGPTEPRSTVLTEAEEAMIVAFRRHALLPLDDCLYALRPSVPHLTRSALHRCLQRHGISRLPDVEGDKPKRQKFKRYPIGFFHIDIAEVQTAEGKLSLFVGIDRTAKFAVAQLVETADRRTAWEFLQHMLEAVPYQVHTILTDNGIQFAEQPRNRNTLYSRPMRFDMICEANGIEHRLTKPNHPWTTDVIDKSFLVGFAKFSSCAWVTAWRRAGTEVRALPRSLYRRTSFAASVRALFGPRLFQPETKRA